MAQGNFPIHHYTEDDALNEHVRDPGDPDGVIAAEQQKSQQQPAQSQSSRPPKRGMNTWVKILAVIVLIAAAAYGSYWLGNRQAAKNQTQKQVATSGKSANTAKPAAATPTKSYSSTTYALSFSYPQTWTVSDTAAQLTVTSPDMQLTVAGGGKTTARVVVAMRNPQTTIAGFPDNGAIAALDSAHLTYAKPSSVQRAQTYLSYLSYTSQSSLDALYITGDNGYQQGQLVPLSDVIKGNPLISVTFGSCTDENCNSMKAISLQANAWSGSQAAKDVINLLQSITLTE